MNYLYKFALIMAIFLISITSNATVMFDLKNQQNDVLKSFVPSSNTRGDIPAIKEISRFSDPINTLHVRVQQYYQGYPIWNAHAVLHVLNTSKKRSLTTLLTHYSDINSVNGMLYQDLENDLHQSSNTIFTKAQADRAIQAAIDQYKKATPNRTDITANNVKTVALVFIDDHTVAHWGYKITFDVPANTESQLPAKPEIEGMLH